MSDLNNLDKKLKEARGEFEQDHNPQTPPDQGLSDGAKAGAELVGAVLGGALLGWGIDKWLETSPVFFLIFVILGVITGFYNIYKITLGIGSSVGYKELQEKAKTAKQSPPEDEDD